MNCLALRLADDIIVIDAGLMFPEEELLGVDIVVPDISYLIENRDKVRGIVLTHGHEDHIGGLPWILSELNVPVYGTEFTLAYVEGKLEEHRLLDDAELIEILPGRRFTLGPFSHHAHPRHALAGRLRRARHPHPRRHRPPHRRLQDRPLARPTASPSTSRPSPTSASRASSASCRTPPTSTAPASRPAKRPSSRASTTSSPQTKKKLFFSCFSSSIHRIRIAMELAHKHGRKVAIIGRSIDNSTEIAQDLGYLDPPQGLIIHPGQIKRLRPPTSSAS